MVGLKSEAQNAHAELANAANWLPVGWAAHRRSQHTHLTRDRLERHLRTHPPKGESHRDLIACSRMASTKRSGQALRFMVGAARSQISWGGLTAPRQMVRPAKRTTCPAGLLVGAVFYKVHVAPNPERLLTLSKRHPVERTDWRRPMTAIWKSTPPNVGNGGPASTVGTWSAAGAAILESDTTLLTVRPLG